MYKSIEEKTMKKNHFMRDLKKRGTPFKVVLLLGFLGFMFVNMGCSEIVGAYYCDQVRTCQANPSKCTLPNLHSSSYGSCTSTSSYNCYRCSGSVHVTGNTCYSWRHNSSKCGILEADMCADCP